MAVTPKDIHRETYLKAMFRECGMEPNIADVDKKAQTVIGILSGGAKDMDPLLISSIIKKSRGKALVGADDDSKFAVMYNGLLLTPKGTVIASRKNASHPLG